ncbi:MAG TPA: PAS domain-containing protein, partial [Blastocatellia bacterium]|nr:PAS domain-containing protein [Blastocatellia bacterium]
MKKSFLGIHNWTTTIGYFVPKAGRKGGARVLAFAGLAASFWLCSGFTGSSPSQLKTLASVGSEPGVIVPLTVFFLVVGVAMARWRVHGPNDYQRFFESALVGMFRATPDGQLILANNYLVTLLGATSPEQLSSVGLLQRGSDGGLLKVLRERGEVSNFDLTWVKPDNSPVHVRISARAVTSKSGGFFYEGTVQDVTEALARESELTATAAKFQSIFEHAGDVILVVDPKTGVILDANPKACETYDYRKQELLGLNLTALAAPGEDGQSFIQAIGAGHLASLAKTVQHTRDGRRIHFQACLSTVEFGGQSSVLCILRDVEDRIRYEKALNRADVQLRSALDSVPQSVYCKDTNGKYTFANASFLNWAGKTAAEIPGKTDLDFFPKDIASRHEAQDKQIINSRTVVSRVEESRSPDGRPVFLETVKAPMLDERGEVFGITGAFRDVTAEKLAEEESERDRGFI